MSTTVETFQDLSLPIPGKEDLAKLHSAIYQNVPAKSGACGDSYAAQGWLAFIVEYIRRYVPFRLPETQDHAGPAFLGLAAWAGDRLKRQSTGVCRDEGRSGGSVRLKDVWG